MRGINLNTDRYNAIRLTLVKTMKAAVKTAEGDFEIKEVPMPEITRPDYARACVFKLISIGNVSPALLKYAN